MVIGLMTLLPSSRPAVLHLQNSVSATSASVVTPPSLTLPFLPPSCKGSCDDITRGHFSVSGATT